MSGTIGEMNWLAFLGLLISYDIIKWILSLDIIIKKKDHYYGK